MGTESIFIAPDTKKAKEKLERSIATRYTLRKGHIITEQDIHMLSPGTGLKWTQRNLVIGKTVIKDISENELIMQTHLQ